MRHTFAGLGASRAEVEALLQRPAARNEFITHALQKRSKYSYAMADGKFRWDDKHVHFDFYGQGKLRTITVLWSEVQAGPELLDGLTFAPSVEKRWVGKLTEFTGTAHRIWKTPQWEIAAWNTVNSWCTPATRHGVDGTAIHAMRDAAAKAWARLTEDGAVYYFLPHPEGEVPLQGKYYRYYLTSFLRHFPDFTEPHWRNIAPTSEQAEYLAVAWDQYQESDGKSFAPLRGLGDLLSKRRR